MSQDTPRSPQATARQLHLRGYTQQCGFASSSSKDGGSPSKTNRMTRPRHPGRHRSEWRGVACSVRIAPHDFHSRKEKERINVQRNTGRHRPGQAGISRLRDERRRRGRRAQALAARGSPVVPGAAAEGLHGGDGGVRERAPLGPARNAPRPSRADDEPAVRGAVREVEQERRQRGRDCGGVDATLDALRGREVGGAAAHPAGSPGAADGRAQPHGAVQPVSTAWCSSTASSRRRASRRCAGACRTFWRTPRTSCR